MLAFLLRRIFEAVVVMVVVAFIAFSMFRFMGDPVANMMGPDATMADRQAMRERLGLDRPFPIQFGHFIEDISQGNFGVSFRVGRPVIDLIGERLPATLELAFVSGLFALAFGLGFGVYTALRRSGLVSRAIMAISLIGVSLPTFLIGIGLIYLFAVELRWLPSFGRGDVVRIGGWTTGFLTRSGLASLVLPAITLGLFQMTLIMRLVRAEMLEVLRQDYIRFARARGLTDRAVHFRHALKNTLVPVITVMGLQLGSIVAFSIITETVFQWPGIGSLFISSVQAVDIPVMATYLLFVAGFFVAVNLIVDLLYFAVDPRLRGSGGH
ncbi:ABC transporter permease protein [Azorhizobium caulinodans ORS 571]|uniref:ABC transporter permease protein n=1 Tax=Azorhizobium caulinodans (strain ATCC 43989 / DSM 5975 / JCM 20966 / LMG 6465 / NBRC 14845 / NCIMB 13405 / ORS 571) TaxID=438753 RepID=A8I361_AZOC5|nr:MULTISPECIES: ABC transporter permease [Azorhizobium]TDT99187.1 peptide/nickel transport system permease protein [Azorhizobium sp. AG788]BAF87983.1 ABC transporter permease protein [Azorhizobium caulinodans ORS 571]